MSETPLGAPAQEQHVPSGVELPADSVSGEPQGHTPDISTHDTGASGHIHESPPSEGDAARAREMLQQVLQQAQSGHQTEIQDASPIPTPQSLASESPSPSSKMTFELPKIFSTLQKISSFITAPIRGFMSFLRSVGRWIVAK